MEIGFNEKEEKAIQVYADKHKITFGEAMQKMIDAMTKGLLDLAAEDGELGMGEQANRVDIVELKNSDIL